MAWLKLTWESGEPLRLNSELVEAYQKSDKGGTILSTNDGGYEVKESLEEVDIILGLGPLEAKTYDPNKVGWK